MRNTINNGLISITIKDHGAELCSLKTNHNNKEYIWQADPEYWGKHSPLLFPIVGCLKDNHFTFEGKQYELPRHGFARDYDFDSIAGNTDNQLKYLFRSNEKTLKMFPFEFELLITYQLTEQSVDISYEVRNKGDKTMYFSIGAHPAFNCPISEGGQTLEFEEAVTLESHIINPENGLIEKGKRAILKDQKELLLQYDLFKQDALIFDLHTINNVTIKNGHTDERVKVSFEGFPYLGIWTPQAPFICIEPWYGIADSEDFTGTIEQKRGIVELEQGKNFNCSYRIEIL